MIDNASASECLRNLYLLKAVTGFQRILVKKVHEISVAQSILDMVTNIALQNNAKKVMGIKLRIGEYSCINLDSLQFAFSCISQDGMAEGAELITTRCLGSDVLEIESIEVDE
ncbi:MAG: hydrogenase maturation nickel metallochaperone HypA [Candidatus Desantisbacteria bacterium]